MGTHRKIDRPMFLYWPDLPKMAEIWVVRTRSRQKTVEYSMTHLMQIIARMPMDYPVEAVKKYVLKESDGFKHHAKITVFCDTDLQQG